MPRKTRAKFSKNSGFLRENTWEAGEIMSQENFPKWLVGKISRHLGKFLRHFLQKTWEVSKNAS